MACNKLAVWITKDHMEKLKNIAESEGHTICYYVEQMIDNMKTVE